MYYFRESENQTENFNSLPGLRGVAWSTATCRTVFRLFIFVFWDVLPCKIIHGSTSQKTNLNFILAAVRT
jgi:hypothetical protein